MPLHWPAFITLLNLLLLFILGANVSRARGKYGVKAPIMSGNENFERASRAHLNTVESTVMFLPALWLMAYFFNPPLAAILGAIWLFGRVWYAFAYINASPRTLSFVVATLAWFGLMLGAAYGVIRAIIYLG